MSHFRVFEMFETTNVMMGNDPIARNVVEMMNGLRELELIDILDMLLLQSTVSEVFTNWDPVKEYMENRLNLSPKTVEIVSKSDLDIPGVRYFQIKDSKKMLFTCFLLFFLDNLDFGSRTRQCRWNYYST